MQFKDRKLKDLVVKRPDASTLHVVYKDGTREVLQRTSSAKPYRIIFIDFENGERLQFRYAVNGELEKIIGHSQESLLTMVYSGNRLQYTDTRVDSGRQGRPRFTQVNGSLIHVTAP